MFDTLPARGRTPQRQPTHAVGVRRGCCAGPCGRAATRVPGCLGGWCGRRA